MRATGKRLQHNLPLHLRDPELILLELVTQAADNVLTTAVPSDFVIIAHYKRTCLQFSHNKVNSDACNLHSSSTEAG